MTDELVHEEAGMKATRGEPTKAGSYPRKTTSTTKRKDLAGIVPHDNSRTGFESLLKPIIEIECIYVERRDFVPYNCGSGGVIVLLDRLPHSHTAKPDGLGYQPCTPRTNIHHFHSSSEFTAHVWHKE